MNKKICISAICAVVLATTLNASENLGMISVNSTTIDDKFESKKSSVSNTVVVNSAEIEKINPSNIVDVFNTIPGMTAQNVGNDIVKVHIRGVDNHLYMGERPGVIIVIDGVPVQETSGKINVDLDNIESFKVIKGGASFLYGNDAIGGAVVITTKRPKAQSSSKIETEVGSFGLKRLSASTNQSFKNSALQIQGSTRDSDGYWEDSYLKHTSLNGKYQYYIDDSSDITVGLDYTKRETGDGNSVKGIAEATTNPESKDYLSYSGYYNSDLIKSFVTYSKDFEDQSNFMFNAYRYTDDKTYYSSRHRSGAYHQSFIEGEWIQNGIKSEYRKPFKNFAVMAGIDIQRNSVDSLTKASDINKTIGATTGDTTTKENINAIYLELKNQISTDLTTTINARYDNIKHDYDNDLDTSLNVSPSYNHTSYRAGLNYDLNSGDSLYTSISTGFRAPTAGQISSNKDGMARGYTVPESLNIETTVNYEVGLRGNVIGHTYDASVYQLDRKDYIAKRAGSYADRSLNDPEDGYYDNLGDLRSRGFELSLQSDRKKEISYNIAYTYLNAKFEKLSMEYRDINDVNSTVNLSGNTVPRTSAHTLNLTIDYKPTDNITVSPELIAKSSYYADDANIYKMSGYEVVNLRGTYKIKKNLEFFAKIDNLLDRNYYTFVTSYSYDADEDLTKATFRVAAPRAYYAGLRYKF